MRTFKNIGIAIIASATLVSCFNDKKPNYQYFPNMYEPVSYETYTPYDYENSTEGLERAKAELNSPYEVTEENLATGAQLYTLYCAVCHGDKGDGKGILVTREKFLGIPSYADAGRNITMGGTYHVETYGLNAMGSYASQVNEKERWQIAMHVMNLKASLKGEPGILETATAAKDSTNVSEEKNMDAVTASEVEKK